MYDRKEEGKKIKWKKIIIMYSRFLFNKYYKAGAYLRPNWVYAQEGSDRRLSLCKGL